MNKALIIAAGIAYLVWQKSQNTIGEFLDNIKFSATGAKVNWTITNPFNVKITVLSTIQNHNDLLLRVAGFEGTLYYQNDYKITDVIITDELTMNPHENVNFEVLLNVNISELSESVKNAITAGTISGNFRLVGKVFTDVGQLPIDETYSVLDFLPTLPSIPHIPSIQAEQYNEVLSL